MAVAVFGTLAALSASSACDGGDECEFDSVTRSIGGPGLIECGIAELDASSDVDDCAVDAYRAGQTFRAIYAQADGGLRAIVHAAGDTYHVVTLGGEDGRIERAQCEDGLLVQESGRSYIECREPGEFRNACE